MPQGILKNIKSSCKETVQNHRIGKELHQKFDHARSVLQVPRLDEWFEGKSGSHAPRGGDIKRSIFKDKRKKISQHQAKPKDRHRDTDIRTHHRRYIGLGIVANS